ncbi:hypothetical protein [Chitinophaga sp. XS-30]|uniref:HYC_CC_PP family protein n=1 Tax=Chitinophaga sp. XS-30 TaxID=2604421 RepID=UPI0011DE4281|nr:hypothetical protein [Chitinophaga sp. XS-30]QEH42472.1 hypothetical protein FW415_16980 [Chitinophaga sp. XS-30]
MKKIVALILAVLYMASSTGATFHMHYCNGKLVDVALWHGEQHPCEKCGPETGICAKSCCEDEHKTVKLDNDQQSKESSVHFMQPAGAVIPLHSKPDFSAAAVLPVKYTHRVSHAPPRVNPVETHILYCTFLI